MGNNPEVIGAAILSFRLLLHVVTAFSIMLYMSERRSRCWPTVIAIIGGGCSLAAFFQGVGEFHSTAPRTQPWVMGVTFAFAAACLYSRGNMALIFSHKWRWPL